MNMKTLKAGCVLIDKENQKAGLIYRDKQDDYTFPKGHLEPGETLVECAIRETAEETKRDCVVTSTEPLAINHYNIGEEQVEVYYYLAYDIGKSDNTSEDTHKTFFIPYDEVYDKLSYPSLKKVWNSVKDKVKEYFE